MDPHHQALLVGYSVALVGWLGTARVILFLDAGLGVLVLVVLRRAQDIWWFWCVHFAMDMMQFDALPQAG